MNDLTAAPETLPEVGPERVDAAAFERMLLDPDVPDEALRPFLIASAAESEPFRPVVEVNPARVAAATTESAMALASLNGVSRWRREQRYRRKVEGWHGVRIVSEGDSWFQYPFLLKDVVDWLSESYAVRSLDAAGDLLSDMLRQGELMTAVLEERPHAILLSGGGNDLLGGARLARALLPFAPERATAAYLGEAFAANLAAVLRDYGQLFARLRQVAPETPIICHVYDRALPTNGRWLGKPMAGIGIVAAETQRAVVAAIVDRFHAGLTQLAARFSKVTVVDTRGSVGVERWYDELHPTDEGYRAVAGLLAQAIAKATGTPLPELLGGGGSVESAMEGASEDAMLDPFAEVERTLALLDLYSEDALLAEIGRRAALAEAGDPIGDEPLFITPSSASGDFPGLRAQGAREAVAAARAARVACCMGGDDLASTVRAGRAALAGRIIAALDLPPSRATLLSALLARRLGSAAPEALCRDWERLTRWD